MMTIKQIINMPNKYVSPSLKKRHFLKLTDQPIINNKMIMRSFFCNVRKFRGFLNLSVALHTTGSSFFTASIVVASAFGRPATIEKKPLMLKSLHSTSIHFGGALGWRIDESITSHQCGPGSYPGVDTIWFEDHQVYMMNFYWKEFAPLFQSARVCAE